MSRKQSIALTRQFLVTRLFPNLNSPKELDSNQQKGTVTSHENSDQYSIRSYELMLENPITRPNYSFLLIQAKS